MKIKLKYINAYVTVCNWGKNHEEDVIVDGPLSTNRDFQETFLEIVKDNPKILKYFRKNGMQRYQIEFDDLISSDNSKLSKLLLIELAIYITKNKLIHHF